jgi:hypothetical protein
MNAVHRCGVGAADLLAEIARCRQYFICESMRKSHPTLWLGEAAAENQSKTVTSPP